VAVWWQVLEQLDVTTADPLPSRVSEAQWSTRARNACTDVLRRWEGQMDGLTARPERAFHAAYVARTVPDPITRELLVALHWKLRAANDPEPRPLPLAALAQTLQQVRDELAAAGYPAVSTDDAGLSREAARYLALLPQQAPSDLAALDRDEACVQRDIEQALAALHAAGGRARTLAEVNLERPLSRRLSAHRLPDGATRAAGEAPSRQGETAAEQLDRRQRATGEEGEDQRHADLRALTAVLSAVEARMARGEPLADSLRGELRARHGWHEGDALAERILGDPALLAATSMQER